MENLGMSPMGKRRRHGSCQKMQRAFAERFHHVLQVSQQPFLYIYMREREREPP